MANQDAGPAEITLTPLPSGAAITITRDDQLEDATVTVEQDFLELRSQLSSRPISYLVTGKEIGIALSIGKTQIGTAADDPALALMAVALNESVVPDGVTPTKQKIDISDNAGLSPAVYTVLLKPYVGGAVSTNANEWITLPNAQVISRNAWEVAFGLQTQRSYNVFLFGQPDGTGIRATIGDTTVA